SGCIRVSDQDGLAPFQSDRSRAPEEPIGDLRDAPATLRRSDLFGRSGERVTEAVERPHETRLVRLVSDRGPHFRQKARERSVRNERSRPELLVDLVFRESAGTALQKELEKLKSLGRDVHRGSPHPKLPG